ncbi:MULTISPECIES: hypothetical protein [Bacillus]|uniref:hypothetical protein n=1 Tax=Bacillus TaxID=1386 RepID=UPI000D029568|nr:MULTISPECIES: hypothetical protein [Bacillus]MBZ4223538.1 hypothetical protein [Bacillus wiedmannii]MCI0768187.1 hypothetical protein [Bacillus sp. TL12]MCP9280617.1 hypothetical protein [Bacillus wiedmannii]PRT28078.1 hypothetical protein C6358_27480 [Bacillus wiedmannii]PRT39390.1 hypothetical protein C6359_27515 [Bacillus wiedmannii]
MEKSFKQPTHLPMEAEVHGYLVYGSSLVIFVSLAILIYGMLKYKSKTVIWFILHLATFSVSLFILLRLLLGPNFSDYNMESEDNSVQLALAGISWIISMFFLLKGVFKLLVRQK